MILCELFNQVEGAERLDRDDPLFRHHSNWYDAYTLHGDKQDTVFFFVKLGIQMEKKFSYNFASYDTDIASGYMSYKPTGSGDQFRVYATAASVLREFIEREKPIYVAVEGFDDRQHALYKKAMQRASLPPGYEVWDTYGVLMIVDPKQHAADRRRAKAAEKAAETAHLRPLQGDMDGFRY